MIKKYGQTWWGMEWLKALSHIDYSNRLPRGRSYANKGAVTFIETKGNTITATVQGSRRQPYEVSICVPAFSDKEKKLLTDNIMSNPLLLSKLLNRQLPESLNQIALKNRIHIFPKRWDDFTMDCSCPDWAVPCKHLAAVINIVANEIDRNPFVIFKLHNYDIIKSLQERGIQTISESVSIPSMADFSKHKVELESVEPKCAHFENIDFSIIGDMRENLLSLLNSNPLFYPKDFKLTLDKLYKKSSKELARSLVLNVDSDENDRVNYEKFNSIELSLKDELFFKKCTINSDDEILLFKECDDLTWFLSDIPAKYIRRLSSEMLYIYFAYHFAQKLVEKSAFIPQIVQLADKSYAIRWLPALMNENVNRIFNHLASAYPKGLAFIDKSGSKPDGCEKLKRLMSLFIKSLIRESGQASIVDSNILSDLFTEDFSYPFKKLGETEIPATIQAWLEKFYLSHNKYVPILEFNEYNDTGLFQVKIGVENSEDSFQEPISLKSVLRDKKYKNIQVEVVRNLDLLTDAFPALEKLMTTSDDDVLVFNADEFSEVLFKIIPLVKLYGIKIILPKALKHLVRPKISMSLSSSKPTSGTSFLKLGDLLNFKWQIALGDTLLDQEAFLNLVDGFSGIVKINQQYVYLNQEDLQSMLNTLNKNVNLSHSELLQAAISGEYENAKIQIDSQTQLLIDELLKSKDVELPESLNATLRPYQKRGYDWLFKNAQLGFGSIIADDMGLGKTIQVISMILKLKVDGKLDKQKALIVVPTTLMTNWENEINKFAPVITHSVYHGLKRQLNLNTDVVISSYGMVRSDISVFSKHKWKVLVIDEAQNIKNASTAQTKAIKKLKSEIRIAMSGTPVENRLLEYWSLFDFVNKGYLGNIKKFAKEFATPIELYRNKEKLDRFLKITSPFILRRLKSDKSIIGDLPDKIENNYFASLEKEQTAIYQNVLDGIMNEIEGTDADNAIQRKGLVLKLIMSLKQICNHPAQFLKKGDKSPELSGKAKLFVDLLDNINEANEKVIIFTQFKEMGVILQDMIKKRFDTDAMFLHGGTSRKKRDDMVDDFQNNSHNRIFILSIKAGGTGLNLTAANHVIHYDLWWNPAVETQATDRAYRIGQNKNVMVYRLITKGTFEEKINEMLIRKKELADLTVASGEKWIGELPDQELKELFAIQ